MINEPTNAQSTVEQLTEQIRVANDMLLTIAGQRDNFANQTVHLTAQVKRLERQIAAMAPQPQAPAGDTNKTVVQAEHDEADPSGVAAQKVNGKAKNGAHAAK